VDLLAVALTGKVTRLLDVAVTLLLILVALFLPDVQTQIAALPEFIPKYDHIQSFNSYLLQQRFEVTTVFDVTTSVEKKYLFFLYSLNTTLCDTNTTLCDTNTGRALCENSQLKKLT